MVLLIVACGTHPELQHQQAEGYALNREKVSDIYLAQLKVERRLKTPLLAWLVARLHWGLLALVLVKAYALGVPRLLPAVAVVAAALASPCIRLDAPVAALPITRTPRVEDKEAVKALLPFSPLTLYRPWCVVPVLLAVPPAVLPLREAQHGVIGKRLVVVVKIRRPMKVAAVRSLVTLLLGLLQGALWSWTQLERRLIRVLLLRPWGTYPLRFRRERTGVLLLIILLPVNLLLVVAHSRCEPVLTGP